MFWMTDLSNPAAWTRGVCQQAKLLRHVPLLYEMATQVDSLLVGRSVTKQKQDGNRPWHWFETEQRKYDCTTIVRLCQRYPGLTPAIIADDLRRIGKIERLPAIIRLRSLEIILQTEDL